MIKMSIGNKSLNDALKNINRYQKGTEQSVRDTIAATALEIEGDAKKIVPTDTGRLKTSIASDFKYLYRYNATVGTNVEYAPFVEFGTYKMPARPFLYPSANRNKSKFLRRMRSALVPK